MTSAPLDLLPSDSVTPFFNPQWTSVASSGESSGRVITFTTINAWSEDGTTSAHFQVSISNLLPIVTTSSSPSTFPTSATSPSSSDPRTPTSTQHTVNSSTPSPSNSQPHTRIIVGVLVGVFGFIMLLACAMVLWLRRSKKRDIAGSNGLEPAKLTPFIGTSSFSNDSPDGVVTGHGQSDGRTSTSVVASGGGSRGHIIDLSSEKTESIGRSVASGYKTRPSVEERLNKVMQKLEIIEAAIQLHTHGWQPSGQGKSNVGHYSESTRSRGTTGVDAVDDRPPRYALNLELATSSRWTTTDIANKDLNRIV